jgi:Amidohydrolase family
MPEERKLTGVHLVHKPSCSIYDVKIQNGKISSIQQNDSSSSPNGKHSMLLPSLCHPHIHLDKTHLLSSDYPQYADLVPTEGTFQEALSNTSEAKGRYSRDDLEHRGSQLIAESIRAGVTAMRAFVEVDHVTKFLCLEVASTLKERFVEACHVQIVAFAQDPIFSSENGDENRRLLEQALEKKDKLGIDVLGTTPYVETDTQSAHRNIEFAIQTALTHDLHLDFHLDYNLDSSRQPMIYHIIDSLKKHEWLENSRSKRTIVLGHCTRLTLIPDSEMRDLATNIRDSGLPISFIGLPTSDLYMMGRPEASKSSHENACSQNRPRGTLQVMQMIKDYGLSCAISLNNVLNPFTPPSPSSADPLYLANLGVGLYHAGTEEDAATLYECISSRARRAIGLDAGEDAGLEIKAGDEIGRFGRGLILFEEYGEVEVAGVKVQGRGVRSVRDVVWCPPEIGRRKVLY